MTLTGRQCHGINPPASVRERAALSEIGERQISAIARNYYLSAAQYRRRDLPAR